MADRLSPDEKTVLGGMPDMRCSQPLADIFFVFLEGQLRRAGRGFKPDESVAERLIDNMASEKLLYDRSLKVTNSKAELTRASKILAVCVLDKLLTLTRYEGLRTPDVCQGMAAVLIKESTDFLHYTTGVKPGSPNFGFVVADFCPKIIGRGMIGQGADDKSIGHHLMKIVTGAGESQVRQFRVPEPVSPSLGV